MATKNKAEAAAEAGWAARAAALTSRGTVYTTLGKEFPPGEWVAVSDHEAELLKAFNPSLTVRRHKENDGA